MRINKAAKLELCVSEDRGREPIHHIYVEKPTDGEPIAVATDGRMLVAVPVVFEEGDDAGLIPIQALKEARRQQKKDKDECVKLKANGSVQLPSGMSFERPDYNFPAWRHIIPSAEPKFRICFDPALLKDLADAMGAQFVTLEMVDENAAIKVLPSGKHAEERAFGVLMPVRMA